MKSSKKRLGKVFHYDLYGLREKKYDFLKEKSLKDIDFEELKNDVPYYFFVPKDFELKDEYEKGFGLSELFENGNSGVETAKDNFIVKHNDVELASLCNDIEELSVKQLSTKYSIKKEKIEQVKSDYENSRQIDLMYRPFDIRKTLYSENSQGVLWRPRHSTMKHFINKNVGVIVKRGFSEQKATPCFISITMSDRRSWSRPGMQGAETLFPLYLYPDQAGENKLSDAKDPPYKGGLKDENLYKGAPNRTPNLDKKIVEKIAKSINLKFTPEKEKTPGTFAPIDILDYIYAVLHSPTYREKYKEFLKIDFPRVPYPKDKKIFWSLVRLGGELREIHLLKSPKVEEFITGYPIDDDNIITRKLTKTSIGWELTDKKKSIGRVWINDTQYFENVPLIAWEFYIGGYQPAQKWLKDRRNRKLEFEDILHYQKIIVALSETDKIMKIIDKIDIE